MPAAAQRHQRAQARRAWQGRRLEAQGRQGCVRGCGPRQVRAVDISEDRTKATEGAETQVKATWKCFPGRTKSLLRRMARILCRSRVPERSPEASRARLDSRTSKNIPRASREERKAEKAMELVQGANISPSPRDPAGRLCGVGGSWPSPPGRGPLLRRVIRVPATWREFLRGQACPSAPLPSVGRPRPPRPPSSVRLSPCKIYVRDLGGQRTRQF